MRRDVPQTRRVRLTTRLLTETGLSTPASRLAGVTLLAAVTLPPVMAPIAALAQCNSNSNPPPPPRVVANFSNQSFGNNAPLMPYNVTSFSLVGCKGPDIPDPGF